MMNVTILCSEVRKWCQERREHTAEQLNLHPPGARSLPMPLCPTESTQTVQALQHSGGDGPVAVSKEVEIQSLKEEIEALKKQIAGIPVVLYQHGLFMTVWS